ncbi:MAG: NADP-dependent oxidoreductase [Actinomycetales bacterium]|nr:NADP-dependent oxidoreductase [Actinomycetales bacterium]
MATAYGGAEVLEVTDVDVPDPGEGELVVDIRAAAYNPADWKIYGGLWGRDPDALPRLVGLEGAGVVSAVGPGSSFAVGDPVVLYPASGTFAERVLVRESGVVPMPLGVAWDVAAGTLLTGVTAWHALDAVGLGESGPGIAGSGGDELAGAGPGGSQHGADGEHRGEVLLVHGGAGGVGAVVVQLAVLRGARVIATAGASNHEYLRSLGAEPVAYGDGLAERVRAIGGVTAAIDTVGTHEAIDVSVELVADRLRVATVAGLEHGAERGVLLLGHGPGMDAGREIRAAARGPLLELVASGRLQVRVAQVFPLDRVREAHELIVSGHARGKVVLLP